MRGVRGVENPLTRGNRNVIAIELHDDSDDEDNDDEGSNDDGAHQTTSTCVTCTWLGRGDFYAV